MHIAAFNLKRRLEDFLQSISGKHDQLAKFESNLTEQVHRQEIGDAILLQDSLKPDLSRGDATLVDKKLEMKDVSPCVFDSGGLERMHKDFCETRPHKVFSTYCCQN